MNFLELPYDIVNTIVLFLPVSDCFRIARVCRMFEEVTSHSSLWVSLATLHQIELVDDTSAKKQIELQFREFRWTEGSPYIKFDMKNNSVTPISGQWENALAHRVGVSSVTAGECVWALALTPRGKKAANYRVGIATTLAEIKHLDGNGTLGERWYPTRTPSEFRVAHNLTDLHIPIPRDSLQWESKPFRAPRLSIDSSVVIACRLVLTESRQTLEMWSSAGAYFIWKGIPRGVGYVAAVSVSGTTATILPNVVMTAQISSVIPGFVDYFPVNVELPSGRWLPRPDGIQEQLADWLAELPE